MSNTSKNLHIAVFGGTLASEDCSDDPNVQDLQPKRGKVQQIWEQEVDERVKELYKSQLIEEHVPFDDSINFNCNGLERIATTLREHFRQRMGNVVVVVGSDQGAQAAHVIADAIDPVQQNNASIIVVASMEASPPRKRRKPQVMWSQAGADLTNAVYLSTRDEMKGKTALYSGGTLFPARGLKKIESTDTTQPFVCRYAPVTVGRNPPVYEWESFRTQEPVSGSLESARNVLLPTGTSARYKLIPGVEAFPVDAISNYANIPAFVEGGLGRGTLQGLIVPAPGKGDFRNNKADIDSLVEGARLCLDAGVPFMTISDPHQKHNPNVIRSIAAKPAHYGSAAKVDTEALFHGCPLNLVEAKVVMSESIHFATKKLGLIGSDLVHYVNEELTQYRRFVQNLMMHEDYMIWKRKLREG